MLNNINDRLYNGKHQDEYVIKYPEIFRVCQEYWNDGWLFYQLNIGNNDNQLEIEFIFEYDQHYESYGYFQYHEKPDEYKSKLVILKNKITKEDANALTELLIDIC